MIGLPTPAQINALTDIPALRALCDDVERTVLQIEAQLEFDAGAEDDWAMRASNALALHRYTERVLKRRLHKLTHREPERRRTAQRALEDIHPLTARAIAAPTIVEVAGLETIEEIDTAMTEVVEMLTAVEIDRGDEIAMLAADRDEGFLARTNAALRTLRASRVALQNRRTTLTRQAKEAANAARNANRQQRFIDAAKAVLPRETYQSLWDRVFAEEASS